MVEHQVVAVRVGEEGHVADAGVEDVAEELDALAPELGPGRGDVVHVERKVRALLRRELEALTGRLPDSEARLADPKLEAGLRVGPKLERVDVERARALRVGRRNADEVEPRDHGAYRRWSMRALPSVSLKKAMWNR